MQSFKAFRRFVLSLIALLSISQAWAVQEQYTLDNRWDKARERLGLLEDWSSPHTFAQFEKLNIQEGWHCLDAGAGLGGITKWLAEKVGPEGRVDALDQETRFLDEIKLPNVSVLKQDLVTDDLSVDQYDFIFLRDVLMHIPKREAVIEKLVLALKPGGILMVEDLGGMPNDIRFKHFTDNMAINQLTGEVFDILEQNKNMSFVSAYENPFFLEGAGLVDVRAEATMPYAKGGSLEGQLKELTMQQLQPIILAKGVDENLYGQVMKSFLESHSRWWGLAQVTTVGKKAN